MNFLMLTKRGEGMAMKSLERYYDEAIRMLEGKDLPEFMLNIGSAIALAGDDKSKLAKLTYLKAKGLMAFQQHKKAVASIQEALEYNEGEGAFRLKHALGIAKGHLGEFNEALIIFHELLDNNPNNLVDMYTNIGWLYLNFSDKRDLVQAKNYLDLALNFFERVTAPRKAKVLNHYSNYYYHKQDFSKAIEMLNEAQTYADDRDKVFILTNLAEIYLEYKNEDTSLTIQKYIKDAEILGEKFDDKIALGRIYYVTALAEIKHGQLVNALDTLNVSLDYYKKADALSLALDCIIKINELINHFKLESLQSLKNSLKTNPVGSLLGDKL